MFLSGAPSRIHVLNFLAFRIALSNHLWEASADVPDDGAADLVDVDRGDGDLEAGPEAQQEAASVQLPHLNHSRLRSEALYYSHTRCLSARGSCMSLE